MYTIGYNEYLPKQFTGGEIDKASIEAINYLNTVGVPDIHRASLESIGGSKPVWPDTFAGSAYEKLAAKIIEECLNRDSSVKINQRIETMRSNIDQWGIDRLKRI